MLPDALRNVLANYRFKREIAESRNTHETVNFDSAKKIGLLYDATEMVNFEIVKDYVKDIRSRQKEVLALGYVDKKVLPQNQFAQLGLDFFTRKNLNWQLFPNSLEVTNFIKEPFDILLNLSENALFPLRYIAAVSKAKFRVGRFDHFSVPCYDMMIEAMPGTDMKQFINQAEEYLRKIKSK
jgi:hypothetical protein